MAYCSRKYKVVSPGDSGMEDPEASPGPIHGRDDVKGKMRRVVGDLECVLGELKTVVGDLQTLVSQIDVVTTQIDIQCSSTTSGEDSLKSGRKQLSESALNPTTHHNSGPSISKAVSQSVTYINRPCMSPKPASNSVSSKPENEFMKPVVRPKTKASESSRHVTKKSSDLDRGYIRLGHMRTHSDGDPFFTTADLDALLSTGESNDIHDDPMYVSTRVIKPRSRNRHKSSNQSIHSDCVAGRKQGSTYTKKDKGKGIISSTAVPVLAVTCSQSGTNSLYAVPQPKSNPKSKVVSEKVNTFEKPPPVPPKAGIVAQSVSRIQERVGRHFEPSKAFFNMDHRGNNPKFYEREEKSPTKESLPNSQTSLPTPPLLKEQSSCKKKKCASREQLAAASTCLPSTDVDLDLLHSRDKGEYSIADTYSTGLSSDFNLKLATHFASIVQPPKPDPEYSGFYERELDETLEMALAADTLELYDSIDDTESLPLGMEAQHARHSTHSPLLFLELSNMEANAMAESSKPEAEKSERGSHNDMRQSPYSPVVFPEEKEMAKDKLRQSSQSPTAMQQVNDKSSEQSKSNSGQIFQETSNINAETPSEISDDGMHSSTDSFQDIYDSEYDESGCDNDGDDEDELAYNTQHFQHGDLLQNVLPSALTHGNVQYSWTAVVEQ